MSTLIDFRNRLYEFPKSEGYGKITSAILLMKKARHFLVSSLKNIDESEFNAVSGIVIKPGESRKDRLIKDLKKDMDKGIHAVETWHSDHVKGLTEFYNIFFSPKQTVNKNIKTEALTKDASLYRMRKSENYTLFNRKEIFSLPDNLIHLAGKLRFNLDGFPCLYLASNLYLAWEELRRPDFDHVNFALFKPNRDLIVLSLVIPNMFGNYSDFLASYYALVCSAKADDRHSFKFQYTVPNLFMMILCSFIDKGGKIDGIRYLSSRRFESEQFKFKAIDIDSAYVFPEKSRSNSVKKERLSDMFKLSEPRTYFLYNLHGFDFNTKKAHIDDYKTSMFAEIEKHLKSEKLEKCK